MFSILNMISVFTVKIIYMKISSKNYKIKSSSLKKMIDEQFSLNAKLKKKTMKNSVIMKKEKNYKIIIFEKNKLIQNCHFDHFNKVSKKKRKLITFCNQKI